MHPAHTSACPTQAPNSKTNKQRTKIHMNVPGGRCNRCACFQLKWPQVEALDVHQCKCTDVMKEAGWS